MVNRLDNDTAYRLAKLIVLGLVVHLGIIGYVFWVDYSGRVDTVRTQTLSCEGEKRDNLANAEGWRIASEARRRSEQYVTAQKYADLALELENRGAVSCETKFPKARYLP